MSSSGRRRRVAAEGAGFDVDGPEGGTTLGHAFGLIDRNEARRLPVDGGGGDRIVNRLPGFPAGHELDAQTYTSV